MHVRSKAARAHTRGPQLDCPCLPNLVQTACSTTPTALPRQWWAQPRTWRQKLCDGQSTMTPRCGSGQWAVAEFGLTFPSTSASILSQHSQPACYPVAQAPMHSHPGILLLCQLQRSPVALSLPTQTPPLADRHFAEGGRVGRGDRAVRSAVRPAAVRAVAARHLCRARRAAAAATRGPPGGLIVCGARCLVTCGLSVRVGLISQCLRVAPAAGASSLLSRSCF